MRNVALSVSRMRVLGVLVASTWLLSPSFGGAARAQVIDACRYPTDDAARAAWQPVENSLPVLVPASPIAGRMGLRLPCDMTGGRRRAAWERTLRIDLSRADRFSFWFYVDNASSLAPNFSLYFGSGAGWYSATFSAGTGWQHVALDKSRFGTEGSPAGWANVNRVRVSAWRAMDAVTFAAIDDLRATSSDVVVVLGDSGATGSPEANTAHAQAIAMTHTLAHAGIDAGVVTDADVESGALDGRKLAILPYNPSIADPEELAIERYLASGGKVIAFYMAPPRLLAALGLAPDGWRKPAFDCQFGSVRFAPGSVVGLPAALHQRSWNINAVKPVGRNARIVGEWVDGRGAATGIAAVAVSDSGAFMTHILVGDDPEGGERMMLALAARFIPSLWPAADDRAIAEAQAVGEFIAIADLGAFVAKSRRPSALRVFAEGKRAFGAARIARSESRYSDAMTAASEAHRALVAAYCAAHVPRTPEMRAVWCHSADGVAGMTWDAAVKALADNGLNTVVPNMLGAGRAHYASRVQPVDESVATQGDRIAECAAACRKYGVKLHVWNVTWSLWQAVPGFIERMRSEKRTQKDPEGGDIDWLCPSNPANFTLERDTMLEIVRNYDVDGIHFDYIRYPDSRGCYCDGCRDRFEKQFGVTVANWPHDVIQGDLREKYLDFRRSNITHLVQAVSEEARKIKPGIKISAAVFPDWPECRDTVGQDWVSWVEKGYLDFVCPMDYSDDARVFDRWLSSQTAAVGRAVPLCPGIGVTLGDWTLTADQVVRQIEVARGRGGAGFILFNYSPYVVTEILPQLRAGSTAPR